jgi:hypothetical protein
MRLSGGFSTQSLFYLNGGIFVMKKSNPTFVGWPAVTLSALFAAVIFTTPAYCQTEDVALLLQQSPAKGGTVTPIAGVHHFSPDSEVTLNANPEPGYQFLHWLGDVSDPTASSTVVRIDKPKIVIAVYEPTKHNVREVSSGPGGGGGLGGGLFATAADYRGSTDISYSSGSTDSTPQYRKIKYSPIDDNESPPEVPEPATVVLLGFGAIFAFTKRGIRRKCHSNL